MSTEFEEKNSKHTSVYRTLGQGLKILHDHQYAEVDILAIPGLGTNPEECWTWTPDIEDAGKHDVQNGSTSPSEQTKPPKRKFNWLRDSDGLASLFPKSRIMLYDYASAWQGKRKVRATMKSICTWLLDDLREKRKGGNEIVRPLIIVGHSMGGIVAAKTLCIARAKREFEPIVNYTIGCAFFGVPFRGSDMAKIALLYSSVFGNDAYESLLSFMRTEKNDTLDEVTADFMEICTKLTPPVDLFCAWEQNPTAASYSERVSSKVPGLLKQEFFKAGARKFMETGFSAFGSGTHFVEKESAELQGAHCVGLTAGHSDLIKFESITSTKFGPVKVALSKMVQMAKINARKRALVSGERLLPQKFVNQVRQSLEGVDMRSVLRTKVAQRRINTWLSSEPLYQQWLSPGGRADPQNSYLWLKGGAGLGKTNASLAAIQQLTNSHSDQNAIEDTGPHSETFLAYFLCERLPGYCTAEDLLKSLIIQLINQDESLAQHARWFVPNPRYRGPAHLDTRRADDPVNISGAKATATVDNLWKCLQDMIDDPVVNSIHVVLSNIHYLDSNVSTVALLGKLRATAFETMPKAVRTARWLVTSRGDKHIREYLTAECISVIDLDDNVEYGGKVKSARQNHARDAVVQLRLSKKYSPDLAYYIRNFVESQSEDEKWIDILFILLKAKPIEESNLSIRKWLREAGSYSTPNLVDHAWDTILKQDADAMLETEELIQTLTVAYEPPTLAELAVLTQIDNMQRLSTLVKNCAPVVQVGSDSKVTFAKPEFKQRLEYMFFGHPDSSSVARKRYHGLIALRCFKCIKASYDVPKEHDYMFEQSGDESARSPISPIPIAATLVSDDEILVVSQDDDVSQMVESPVSATSTLKGSYPVKYLFQHLSEGFPDAVQELFEDDPDFWGGTSAIRDRWLEDFRVLSRDFRELNTRGMSTLHVAAGIGANDLVSILIDKNGKASSSWANIDGMTALHVAASNNHCDAVDTLIRAGADIETGEGEAGTPLHLAALRGNCAVMTLLIEKEANVNALSKTIGPVINAAIRSGTVEAVQLIMSGAVHFDVDYITYDPPLSLSAGISEPSLFKDILTSGRAKWLQNVKLLDQALIAASYSGRLQSVCVLLKFDHVYTNNTVQTAVLSAAIEKNWASVNELLDYAIKDTAVGNRRNVQLDDTFYFAATNREERLAILEKIWSFTHHSIAQDILNFSLYQATVLNKHATVEWLLERCGADPNTSAERPQSIAHYTSVASSSDFWNPLNAAASSGNIPILKALIRSGAEVDGERVYALQLAARDGHTEAVDILLEHGAAVNKVVADSEELGFFSATALQAACDNKRIGVVGALLKHDADPNLGGGAFTNPITAATQKSQPEILKLLLDAPNIEVNVFGGEDKSTPLINAATYMSVDSVELLVRRGAELDTQNAVGDTALIMASWSGDKDCVVLLCNEGADVTYRSPHRGLAIAAAADGSHPECATILADRMGGKIESYREQVKIDPSKERLKEALAQLRLREQAIGELKADLIEAQEQLESANKDIDFYQHEKKRLMSASSFHGETYESTGQQVRAMQTERAELLKQLDAARGQTGLANEAVDRIQALLNNERKTNASLRQKQELNALQNDIKHAHDSIAAEKQKNLDLQHEIRLLQNAILALKNEVAAVQADEQAAVEAAVIERHKQDALKDDVRVLENKLRAEVLSSVQATAERHAHQPSSPPSRNDLNPIDRNEYPRPPAGRAQSDRDSAPAMGGAARFPRSQTTSPTPQAKSPGTETGFRTIHGQHRADGSMGGYRSSRAVQRTPSDNLYESSVQNGQSGDRTLSPQTSRSDGQSLTSSDGAQSGQGWGTPPKRKGETERTN